MDQVVPFFILDYINHYPTLEIGNLGRFDRIFHSARILPGKSVLPPFVTGSFSSQVDGSSGRFQKFIAYKTGRSDQAVRSAISGFVKQVHRDLNTDGICRINGFGAFYREEDNTLSFRPEKDTFNAEFFGFNPVPAPVPAPGEVKTAPVSVVQASAMAEQSTTAPQVSREHSSRTEKKRRWPVIVPLLLVCLAVCVSGIIYWQYQSRASVEKTAFFNRKPEFDSAFSSYSDEKKEESGDAALQSDERDTSEVISGSGTTSPALRTEGQQTASGEDIPGLADPGPAQDGQHAGAKDQSLALSGSTGSEHPESTGALTEHPSCLIIVGAFRLPANVQRMKERLAESGFRYYAEPMKHLTRVAILPDSCNEEEVHRLLNRVRAEIEKEAWIMQ